jgi:hypothetical protein
MGFKATKYNQYIGKDGELHTVRPGDECEGLTDRDEASFLELGIIEKTEGRAPAKKKTGRK